MKDSKGHGSDAGHGHGFVTPGGRGVMPSRPFRQGTAHQVSMAEQHGVGTDHLVGELVHNAFRNAAAYGPEHASVGSALRQAAGLERDSAAGKRDRLGTGYEMSTRKYPITGRGEHGGVFRTRPRNWKG